MASRLKLHEVLCETLGSRHVYYSPPPSVQMKYPAIVYSLNGIDNDFANDGIYNQSMSYTVTLIDKNPDSEFISKLSKLPMTRFNRAYVSDNLNHYVFTIYH